MRWDSKHRENHKKATTEANRRPERKELSKELMKKNRKIRVIGEFHHSEESKKKISENNWSRGKSWGTPFQKGNEPHNKGKKCPKISNAKQGHVVTLEQRSKNREGTLKYNREHPDDAKKHQRDGALALREKYPEKGDGHFFNTRPEKEMKRCLDENGIYYIFQYAVKNIKHSYVADFYLPLYNIIIEVDGKEIHLRKDKLAMDLVRTQELEESGYRVLRFWESEFDTQSVWREI